VERYLLFDSSCVLCSDLAASVEKASSGALMTMSLYAPEAKAMLDKASPQWKFEPTLVEVKGEKVRAYTGLAMRAHMVTFLNPVQLLKIARLVQQAGVPLFGTIEPREPGEAALDPLSAEPVAESPSADHQAEEDYAGSDGFRFTSEGPDLGTKTPVPSVTTTMGQDLALANDPGSNTLLLFLSTHCPHCHKVAEVLHAYAEDAPERIIVIFGASDPAALDEFLAKHHLASLPIVVSPETRAAFGVTGVPCGVALDQSGTLRGKGIVNNADHLDSLANTFYVSVEAFKQALASRKEERVVVT
jgi:methylamine dehydrogenase accessory protein MauD